MAHRLAPEAVGDIDDIWFYVATESGDAESANRLIEAIGERFLLLATYPLVGRRRDDLRPGVRSFPVGEYVIIYRVEGEDIAILRVAHGRRDLDALLGR